MISTGPALTAEPEQDTKSRGAGRTRSIGIPWFRVLIALSGVLLAISTFFSYWALTLHAPQYPSGLKVTVFTNQVTGDVREVDGLNHYIGMIPLGDAASIERSIAPYAIVAFVILAYTTLFRSETTMGTVVGAADRAFSVRVRGRSLFLALPGRTQSRSDRRTEQQRQAIYSGHPG